MSGATWRGTQLRIAPARPRWSDKLEAERRPPPNEEKRKSKRLRRAIVREGGKHAQDMRLVTEDNVARRTVSNCWSSLTCSSGSTRMVT